MSQRHSAAERFPMCGDELTVGGVALTRLVARVGSTPFYAYDRHLLKARVRELRAVLPPAISLHYAIKANPMPAVVGWMAGLVDGLDVASLSRRELFALRARIGYVFQFSALFDSLSVGENVAMGLRKQGKLTPAEIDERVHEALELVDLPATTHVLPIELSGGMRKRVGIARAIALRPKYLLYDEPTTGLDPVTAAVIDELMLRMQRTLGVTGIVITHDMRSAFTVGTRIAMLYDGKVRVVGTVDEVKHTTDPVVRQFIEGKPDLPAEETAA